MLWSHIIGFFFLITACLQHEFKVHNIPHYRKICQKCNQGTNLDNHKCKNDKKHPCKVCGKVYSKQRNLTLHMQKDHGSAVKTHVCKICKKGFGGYELLKDHKYQAHSQVNCPQCSKILFNRMELRKHQARTSLKRTEPFKKEVKRKPLFDPITFTFIMDGKVCLRCKGKTLLGVFENKKFVDITHVLLK